MQTSTRNTSINAWGAFSLVVSSMMGTGVFTSLGFQLVNLSSPASIVLLWLVGGIIALCGAAVYSELGLTFPGSGGEYNFLSQIYHPLVGFLAGWLSAVVGFAAPIALSAIALGSYAAQAIPGLSARVVSIAAIAVVTVVHARQVRTGIRLQQFFAALIIGIMVIMIGASVVAPAPVLLTWTPNVEIFSAPFAVSLIYVEYAYSGWNVAAYVAGEIDRPARSLPRALLGGTALVCLLYLLLNLAFLRSAPADALRGKVEVAHIAATSLIGPMGARVMSAVLVCVLLGSMSSMLFAGARIPATMSDAYPALRFLRLRTADGAPMRSVLLQAGIALVMVLTGTFESVLTFVGFMLTLCTTLTVAGLFVVRARASAVSSGYRCWGYPVTPLLFLGVNLWMLVFVLSERPVAALVGAAIIAAGIPVWWMLRRGSQVARR